MTDYTDNYRDLLIKQYWDKPNARAEIEAQASTWEIIRDTADLFIDEFDLGQATGDRLDIIGKIVGIPRRIPFVVAKLFFGFDDNSNSRGFDDKFIAVGFIAPLKDKFERAYSDLELSDPDYRLFIRAKIALNTGSGYMISSDEVSIQDVISTLFNGQAYVVDKKDMSLTLYLSPSVDLETIRAILRLELLPKPHGVQYGDFIIQAAPGETFTFADNLNAVGFANKFDLINEPGGLFAEKVVL